MSLLAPEVERYVIGAVRDQLPGVRDARLARACMDFIFEEGGHSRVHLAFNRRLEGQGIDVPAALASVRRATRIALHALPAGGRLAVAAACEHLSALLSLAYLRAGRREKIACERAEGLFDGHAREELGHRAFVFDLLRHAGGGGWFARLLALAMVTMVGAWCAMQVLNALLKHDAPQRRLALWWRGAIRLVGPQCWVPVPVLLLGWLSYLRPGFHPVQLPDA